MKTHRIIIIFCGIILIASTFFPWVDMKITKKYFTIFDLNLFSGLAIFAVGLISIFVGIYHKPKPGKSYSSGIVILGVITYFIINNIVGSILQIQISAIGIGTLLSGASIFSLEICGLIPIQKEYEENENTTNWRVILLSIIGIGMVILTFFSISKVVEQIQQLQDKNQFEPSSSNIMQPSRTLPPTISKTKKPIQASATISATSKNSTSTICTHWSEVSLADVGKTKCVYGDVIDSYWGDDIFYIRFSKNPNSFKFISIQSYFKDINGKCIRSTGEIKNFGMMPYIELQEMIFSCEN